jgi:hypothetical protein
MIPHHVSAVLQSVAVVAVLLTYSKERANRSVVALLYTIKDVRDPFSAFFGLDVRVGVFGRLKRAVA